MSQLQAEVAQAADQAESHATAPALLLQAQAALGRLAESANAATEAGRLPFRVGAEWTELLGDLGHVTYLLADQTGVELDTAIRGAANRRIVSATARSRHSSHSSDDWL